MPFDFEKSIRESFSSLGRDNPLRKLNDEDKRLLVAFLTITYALPLSAGFDKELERMSAVIAEAGKLARKIETQVFGTPIGKELLHMLPWAGAMAPMLERFSTQVGDVLENVLGKQGHKSKIAKSSLLITASEFVKTKTGEYCDEHLAELFQALRPVDDPDVSGDAIRKRREHLQKSYPVIYRNVVNRAQNFAGANHAGKSQC